MRFKADQRRTHRAENPHHPLRAAIATALLFAFVVGTGCAPRREVAPTPSVPNVPLAATSSGIAGGYFVNSIPERGSPIAGWIRLDGEEASYVGTVFMALSSRLLRAEATVEGDRITLTLESPVPGLELPPLLGQLTEQGFEGSGPSPDMTGTARFTGVRETHPGRPMSVEARDYLERAFDLMEEHSMNRHLIDWPDLRRRAAEWAEGAQTPRGTYGAIWYGLSQLEDGHSGLAPGWYAPGGPNSADPPPGNNAPPTGTDLGGGLAYLSVPAYQFDGAARMTEMSELYHELIAGLDSPSTCGWVVDVRGNFGGSSLPMLLGVGPILGDGPTWSMARQDSIWGVTTYEGGRLYTDGESTSEQYGVEVARPYQLRSPNAPVAILTDQRTVSSGEVVAIAFRGRANARSFGQPTGGASTGNDMQRLSDGAGLNITTGVMADRNGRAYGGPIEPDVVVDGAPTGDPATDAPLAAAMEWLRMQPACRR